MQRCATACVAVFFFEAPGGGGELEEPDPPRRTFQLVGQDFELGPCARRDRLAHLGDALVEIRAELIEHRDEVGITEELLPFGLARRFLRLSPDHVFGLAAALDLDPLDRIDQVRPTQRLGEVTIEASVDATIARILTRRHGKNDDVFGKRSYATSGLEAVEARHVEVEKNNVEATRAGEFDGLGPIFDEHEVGTETHQHVAHQELVVGAVLGEEDATPLEGASRSSSACSRRPRHASLDGLHRLGRGSEDHESGQRTAIALQR